MQWWIIIFSYTFVSRFFFVHGKMGTRSDKARCAGAGICAKKKLTCGRQRYQRFQSFVVSRRMKIRLLGALLRTWNLPVSVYLSTRSTSQSVPQCCISGSVQYLGRCKPQSPYTFAAWPPKAPRKIGTVRWVQICSDNRRESCSLDHLGRAKGVRCFVSCRSWWVLEGYDLFYLLLRTIHMGHSSDQFERVQVFK